jgi:hypothetical protein
MLARAGCTLVSLAASSPMAIGLGHAAVVHAHNGHRACPRRSCARSPAAPLPSRSPTATALVCRPLCALAQGRTLAGVGATTMLADSQCAHPRHRYACLPPPFFADFYARRTRSSSRTITIQAAAHPHRRQTLGCLYMGSALARVQP